MAKEVGLDFLFLTDHNGYAHNRMLPEVEALLHGSLDLCIILDSTSRSLLHCIARDGHRSCQQLAAQEG